MARTRMTTGGTVRRLRESDAEDIVAIFRSVFGDERSVDAEQIRSWLRNPLLDPELLRVLEIDGVIAGYGDIVIEDDELALDVGAPLEHWPVFFDWAEERARVERSPRVRVLLPAGHPSEKFVAQRGYRLWRSSYTMQIELRDEPPAAPDIPNGIEFRAFHADDEERLRAAMNEAFADDPFFHQATPESLRESRLNTRGSDPTLWVLAWDRDELTGFILPFLERPGEPDLGWIESLGVRPAWRRRGLGEALLRAGLRGLHDRGLRQVGLGVDAENETGALQLYERAGMRVLRQRNNWVLSATTIRS